MGGELCKVTAEERSLLGFVVCILKNSHSHFVTLCPGTMLCWRSHKRKLLKVICGPSPVPCWNGALRNSRGPVRPECKYRVAQCAREFVGNNLELT